MVHRDMNLAARQFLQFYLHPGNGEQRGVATLETDIDVTAFMVLSSGHAAEKSKPRMLYLAMIPGLYALSISIISTFSTFCFMLIKSFLQILVYINIF